MGGGGGSTISVYTGPASTERRVDMRKWDQEIQTGGTSMAFHSFQDKAVCLGEKPDATLRNVFLKHACYSLRKKKKENPMFFLS